MIDPPYPDDLAAKGWSLDLDYERIEQSDTWAIATPEQRPWLLMTWLMAWRQVPIGSLPPDDLLVAARIGLPLDRFKEWKPVLLSGFDLAANGRLYHGILVEYALKMVDKRAKEKVRVAAYRAKNVTREYDSVTRDNSVTNTDVRVCTTPPPPPEPKEQELSSLRSDSSTATPLDLAPLPADTPEAKASRNAAKLSAITDVAIAEYNAHLSKKAGGLLRTATKVGIDEHRKNVARCLRVVSRACAQLFDNDNRIRPEFWRGYFKRCADDDFLAGRSGGGKEHANWKPDFEYLTRPKTVTKLYEMHAQDGDE